MNPEEFRRAGHQLVDWVADYMEGIEDHPVLARVEPGWVRSQLPDHPPEQGEPFTEILADVDRIVLPAITHWQSPSFFAYFPANTSGPSALGELLAAGLGVQGMLWLTSRRARSSRHMCSTGWSISSGSRAASARMAAAAA